MLDCDWSSDVCSSDLVWCGFACPQSVFLEGVYRPIERLIEGPRERRLKARSEPWTAGRVARRVAKYAAFLLVSMTIAHTATAMFVSPKELWLMVNEGPSEHREAFLLTTGFTVVLMFNFTWFREQFCVVLCPYGRLQSVLHDKDSITVAYDEARGEPRGKISKAAGAPKQGDCVDCHKCVHACPTGIDIRNGLQMECLACNQCIDACDEVMVKVGRPKGLITFSSHNQQAGKPRRIARPRVFVYAALMLLAMTTLGVSLATRTPFEANVFLPRGMVPYAIDGETVRNSFELHIFNKNPSPSRFHVDVVAPVPASVVVGTRDPELASLTDVQIPISVSVDFKDLKAPVELTLVVSDEASGITRRIPMRFRAPR
jgi:cytochrome c oxidase accessory protein FixG